jgi:hypothetical protein
MWNRSCIDSIDDYKSVVYLSIYRGGGLDPLQTNFRAYPAILANNRSKKTRNPNLLCARADRPAHRRGPSGPRTVRPQGRTIHLLKLVFNICPPAFWWRWANQKQLTRCYHIVFLGNLPLTRMVRSGLSLGRDPFSFDWTVSPNTVERHTDPDQSVT